MKFFLVSLLLSLSLLAGPPGPGGGGPGGPGGGFPGPGGGGPKIPNIKKPELPMSGGKGGISPEIQKALSQNGKMMGSLNKKYSELKKGILQKNKLQLNKLLDVAKGAGNMDAIKAIGAQLQSIAGQMLNLQAPGSSDSSSDNSDSSSGSSDDSGSDSSDDSSSSGSSDDDEDDEEESDNDEKSESKSEKKSDFPLGRWYETKTYYTLQSEGKGMDSNGDRFKWSIKGDKVTIQYSGKVVRVYIDTDKRSILGLDRKRSKAVHEEN
jgi:hypothetical protein